MIHLLSGHALIPPAPTGGVFLSQEGSMLEEKLESLIKDNPLLKGNGKFFKDLFSYLSTPIEVENLTILRAEIAAAYTFMPLLIRIKARAEALYRMAQKQAASGANLKGTGRDAEINGDTAHYRYARDFTEGLLDTLTSKLSASKTILASLDNERKNTGD